MLKFLANSHNLRHFSFPHERKLLRLPKKRKVRPYCQRAQEDFPSDKNKFVPFLQRLEERRQEARRSVIVQVQSTQSSGHLHSYCSSLGSVRTMLHYTTGVEPLHFIIVEFAHEDDLKNVLVSSAYVQENLAVPTQSHFLWFRAPNKKTAKLKQVKGKLSTEYGLKTLKESEIKDALCNCMNVSDQMRKLYDMTKLNDVGVRLRYLTALQVEEALSGMFPRARIFPFGSSVNGYGRMGCDLDLVLRLIDKKGSDESRLVYHSKAASGSERTMGQRHMEAISDLLYLFLPGCTQVRRILQARIPIIKYQQQLTDVECDLSMSNMSGVYMSDFLYMMGEIDDRVRPLVFTVRQWAKAAGLTNPSPGRWVTNFSLTLLVLAYLQHRGILPALNTLVKLAGSNDRFVTDDGIDCTFLRDLTVYRHTRTNEESLEDLLKGFFAHYSQFDFSTRAVCLNEAVSLAKPDFSGMYIINPLERGLNVSKNVSLEEVERFRREVCDAVWLLESPDEERHGAWGLPLIFQEGRSAHAPGMFGQRHGRLVEVSALFEDEPQRPNPEVEYKNEEVKKQVEEVRKSTKARVQQMKKQR